MCWLEVAVTLLTPPKKWMMQVAWELCIFSRKRNVSWSFQHRGTAGSWVVFDRCCIVMEAIVSTFHFGVREVFFESIRMQSCKNHEPSKETSCGNNNAVGMFGEDWEELFCVRLSSVDVFVGED